MGTELVPRKYRKTIPKAHQGSLDTRIAWLWEQRFGTIQTIYMESKDEYDRFAATLFIQAIIERHLGSIRTIFQRLEGGAVLDQDLLDNEDEEGIRI